MTPCVRSPSACVPHTVTRIADHTPNAHGAQAREYCEGLRANSVTVEVPGPPPSQPPTNAHDAASMHRVRIRSAANATIGAAVTKKQNCRCTSSDSEVSFRCKYSKLEVKPVKVNRNVRTGHTMKKDTIETESYMNFPT